MRLLVIEDETAILRVIKRGLEQAGFVVDVAEDGQAGLDAALEGVHALIVLDLMLPKLDGWKVCEELRKNRVQTPILMLTARAAVEDRVRGLDTGADDYLPKPFDLDELEARVRALARRASPSSDADSDSAHEFSGLRCDAESGAVCFHGELLELAPREAALLRAVLAKAGQAVTKERLSELVFPGESQVQSDAIEVVAYRLRKKLAHTGAQLVTLRGLGYLLKAAS